MRSVGYIVICSKVKGAEYHHRLLRIWEMESGEDALITRESEGVALYSKDYWPNYYHSPELRGRESCIGTLIYMGLVSWRSCAISRAKAVFYNMSLTQCQGTTHIHTIGNLEIFICGPIEAKQSFPFVRHNRVCSSPLLSCIQVTTKPHAVDTQLNIDK